MGASYNKLFKLLIDRKIRKGELCRLAGISGATLTKMSRNENVNSDVLVKICLALDCDIGDIMEVVSDNYSKNRGTN
jgi:DNA-binding Xre family transcriptional regulator